MKKLIFSFVVCFFIIYFAVSFAFAEDNVVEVPDLRIVIDGIQTELKDVPISINQRTLLPLRELAEKLGVPNDDEHIIWNNKEKSVTIIKDAIKVYLKQGSRTVYVNNVPVELDVAPIGYTNSRTYIPFRFLAETFGKKVIWDGKTKSIFVCDAETFEKVKEVMEESDKAMKSVKKYTMDYDVKANVIQDYMETPVYTNITTRVDTEAKKMHMTIRSKAMDQESTTEVYYDENYSYTSVPNTDAWIKQDLEEAGGQGVFGSNDILGINSESYNDIFYSGLKFAETDEESDIILEGNVYFSNMFDMISKSVMGSLPGNIELSDCYLKLFIDKDTYRINEMVMLVNCSVSTAVGEFQVNINMDLDIDVKMDYSEDLEVEIPEEVINNAVEL